jgi:hypothetical protein
MKVVMVFALCALVGCSEDDPARHLPDAPMEPSNFDLVITKDGTGSGTVSSTPTGIACGDTCTASFTDGTMVTLTAEPAADSLFTGWSGACSGDATTCDVTLSAAASVTATFTKKTYTVTFKTAGAGTGGIHGGDVDCTDTCTKTVEHGTMLSLTATPTGLSVFAGWGGACVNPTGTCNVTVTSDTSITASFALDNFSLTVVPAGNGTGSVTSNPTGISCGTMCSHTFTANQMVTLTANPATSSTFAGWSGGGWSGTATCKVTIEASKTVTATFTLKTFALTVTKVGSGTVTSDPNGISCGSACSHSFDYSTTPVTLTATPASGYVFSGFSGACTGMTCSVTMTAARNVTATFTQVHTLTVTKTGDGYGTVTGGSINCGSGAGCIQTAASGTTITLTAKSDSADATQSTFLGWSGGGCIGTGDCSVMVNSDVTVTAMFRLNPNIMFVTKDTFTGDLDGVANADKMCTQFAHDAGFSGNYRAYLSYRTTPNAVVNAPERFADASGWVRPDGKPFMNTVDQMHKGTVLNAPRIMQNKEDVTNTATEAVWTGTNVDGLHGGSEGECEPVGAFAPWDGIGTSSFFGLATYTTARLVRADGFNCGNQAHLYCLGIDRKAKIE